MSGNAARPLKFNIQHYNTMSMRYALYSKALFHYLRSTNLKSVKRRYFLGKGLGAGERIVMVCFSKSMAVLGGVGGGGRAQVSNNDSFVNFFPNLHTDVSR